MSVREPADASAIPSERVSQRDATVEGLPAGLLPQLLWSPGDPAMAGPNLAQPWFDLLCDQIRGAVSGFVLLQDAAGAYAVVASKPIDVSDQVYLRKIAEQSLGSR